MAVTYLLVAHTLRSTTPPALSRSIQQAVARCVEAVQTRGRPWRHREVRHPLPQRRAGRHASATRRHPDPPADVLAARPGRGHGPRRRRGLAGGRTHPAPCPPAHRRGARRERTGPVPTARAARPPRRAARTRRHLRRHARSTRARLQQPTTVHRQRQPRTAHAADRHAHRDRCRPRQTTSHPRRPDLDEHRGTPTPSTAPIASSRRCWSSPATSRSASSPNRSTSPPSSRTPWTDAGPMHDHDHDHPARSPVTGDGVLLERLVTNLVDNAERYNVTDGVISITTATDEAAPSCGSSTPARSCRRSDRAAVPPFQPTR